jgi:hypothetical protein
MQYSPASCCFISVRHKHPQHPLLQHEQSTSMLMRRHTKFHDRTKQPGKWYFLVYFNLYVFRFRFFMPWYNSEPTWTMAELYSIFWKIYIQWLCRTQWRTTFLLVPIFMKKKKKKTYVIITLSECVFVCPPFRLLDLLTNSHETWYWTLLETTPTSYFVISCNQ